MTCYYRMCGIPSTNPSPIYQEDKFKLNELCLRSFVKAFKDVNPKMVFINDFCDGRYNEMIDRIVPFDKDIHSTELGINGTSLFQYELAGKSDDDAFLFQECDYLYRPNTGIPLYTAIANFELVSPYDHLNFYKDATIHADVARLALFEGIHYRTTERNTMSFGMTKQAFKSNYKILKKYGYLDNEVWAEMRENHYSLWVPIPSFATHMVKDFLAPSVDWEALWSNTA